MKLSSTSELNEEPFTHTKEDIVAAAPSFTIIDTNDDKDVILRTNYSLLLNFLKKRPLY